MSDTGCAELATSAQEGAGRYQRLKHHRRSNAPNAGEATALIAPAACAGLATTSATCRDTGRHRQDKRSCTTAECATWPTQSTRSKTALDREQREKKPTAYQRRSLRATSGLFSTRSGSDALRVAAIGRLSSTTTSRSRTATRSCTTPSRFAEAATRGRTQSIPLSSTAGGARRRFWSCSTSFGTDSRTGLVHAPSREAHGR